MDALSVLVVEDHPDGGETLATLLGLVGHRVRLARTCREAMELALARPPDAVLLDLGLPDGDGHDLAVELIRLLPAKPLLVAVTEFHGREEVSRRAGIDHHLLKPADPKVLLRLLADHPARGAAIPRRPKRSRQSHRRQVA
ncbi:MAG: response regulator [Gemmataceae bacterium]|nr:response regulator [Gemmataceae bacterium]